MELFNKISQYYGRLMFLIGLCVLIYTVFFSYPENTKQKQCKQDYYDSILVKNKIWIKASQSNDTSISNYFHLMKKLAKFYIDDNKIDCSSFKHRFDTLTLNLLKQENISKILRMSNDNYLLKLKDSINKK